MNTIQIARAAARRAAVGDGILTAAAGVDGTAIREDLAAFTKSHSEFSAAHHRVAELENRLRAQQQLVDECDAEQGRTVNALAGALMFAGFPSRNPFQSFGGESPSRVRQLPNADEAKAIQRLVAAVRGTNGLPPLVLEAATACEVAASRMVTLAAESETLQATLREQRQARDHLIPSWEAALTALKRTARYVSESGGPGLFAAMFERPSRPTRRARKKAENHDQPASGAAA